MSKPLRINPLVFARPELLDGARLAVLASIIGRLAVAERCNLPFPEALLEPARLTAELDWNGLDGYELNPADWVKPAVEALKDLGFIQVGDDGNVRLGAAALLSDDEAA